LYSIPGYVDLGKQTVQQQIHGTDGIVGIKIVTVLLRYFGLQVKYRVDQNEVIFARPSDVEFDGANRHRL